MNVGAFYGYVKIKAIDVEHFLGNFYGSTEISLPLRKVTWHRDFGPLYYAHGGVKTSRNKNKMYKPEVSVGVDIFCSR